MGHSRVGKNPGRLLIMGCGILEKEVRSICTKNRWDLDFEFFDSALHCDLNELETTLANSLDRHEGRRILVFYGACHPRMNMILRRPGVRRLAGQNGIEMLLGKERFTRELINGAFFLLEEWATRWEDIMFKTYGTYRNEVRREIFKSDRSFILALRTPCSEDFSAQAREIASQLDVPLKWLHVPLDRLEALLKLEIEQSGRSMETRENE